MENKFKLILLNIFLIKITSGYKDINCWLQEKCFVFEEASEEKQLDKVSVLVFPEQTRNYSIVKTVILESLSIDYLPKLLEKLQAAETVVIANCTGAINHKMFPKNTQIKTFKADHNSFNQITSETFKNAQELQKIHLENNEISKITSNAFSGLNHLEELNLTHNEIEDVSRIFGRNSDFSYPVLTTLNLKDNKIKQLQDFCFAKTLGLKFLDLSQNRIEGISSTAFYGLIQLLNMNLRSNRVKRLPNFCFSKNENLKFLDMSKNEIVNVSKTAFKGLQRLKNLKMQDNRIIGLLEGTFNDTVNLKYFDLGNNSIKYISDTIFARLKSIEHIYLNKNGNIAISRFAFGNSKYLRIIHLDEGTYDVIKQKGSFIVEKITKNGGSTTSCHWISWKIIGALLLIAVKAF